MIDRSRAPKTLIHVGFAHTGTTSLQENIFRKHADVFYAGVPYTRLGAIFAYIKYLDIDEYSFDVTQGLCLDLIFNQIVPGQHLILSDETFVDQPAFYFTPPMMPVRTIAERLRFHFGEATILFTIRSQFSSVLSNYNVYKKNSQTLYGIEVESFDAWFQGNTSQLRNLYLRNLDISHAIKIYADVFGAESVKILPLEFLTTFGFDAYRDHLSLATGLPLSTFRPDEYQVRNKSEDSAVVLNEQQRRFIWERAKEGNKWVAESFQLPLQDLGYPFP